MLDIFLYNKECEAAESLAIKLSGPHRPGAIISCSRDEMEVFVSGDLVRITHPEENIDSSEFNLVEIDITKNYLAVVKRGRVNEKSLNSFCEALKGHIKVIFTM